MDSRKNSEVNHTNIAKDDKAQDSNDKKNANEETKEKPLLPNYCDKDFVKGKVVLVVNEEFRNSKIRIGAEKDLDNLKYVFVDKLGFEQLNVQHDFNLQKAELENVLAETAEMDYNDTDIFVFAISTHGEERPRRTTQYEHALICSDDEYVFTTDIITKFSNIPSLAGKPKIFFIQACRIPYDTDETKDASDYDPGHKVKIMAIPANEENNGDRLLSCDVVYFQATVNRILKQFILLSRHAAIQAESEICGPMHTIHTVTKKVDQCSLTENTEKAHATQEKGDAGHRSENDQTSQSQGKAVAGHRIENEGRSQQGSGDPGLNSIHFLSYNRCPKDCLVVYAIQSGLIAWRSERDGSWMFHYLHEVIRSFKESSFVDFFDVLTKTAFGMAKRESSTLEKLSDGKKAVPVIQHRLTKHLSIPLKTLKE